MAACLCSPPRLPPLLVTLRAERRRIFYAGVVPEAETWPCARPFALLRVTKRIGPSRTAQDDKETLRKRSALLTTDTELRLIAAAASAGDSSTPKNGYRTPAATGMPMLL